MNVYINRRKRVVRNTIFRKALPSIVSGYGKRSINLNKVVATFEKHIFLSQTGIILGSEFSAILSNVQTLFRIFSNVQNLFRLCSEFLAQKLVCSDSLDFVVA
jgi:hypothetical protein